MILALYQFQQAHSLLKDERVFKGSRRAYHTFLTSEAISSYLPMQQIEYAKLVNDIATSPEVCLHCLSPRPHRLMIFSPGSELRSSHQAYVHLYHGYTSLWQAGIRLWGQKIPRILRIHG